MRAAAAPGRSCRDIHQPKIVAVEYGAELLDGGRLGRTWLQPMARAGARSGFHWLPHQFDWLQRCAAGPDDCNIWTALPLARGEAGFDLRASFVRRSEWIEQRISDALGHGVQRQELRVATQRRD